MDYLIKYRLLTRQQQKIGLQFTNEHDRSQVSPYLAHHLPSFIIRTRAFQPECDCVGACDERTRPNNCLLWLWLGWICLDMLSHSSLTIPSLHCTVGLYLCVRFFLCSQNKFVSRPEPLRCRAVLFIRGDIMLLFLVRSCSLVLHSAGLGFSPPGFMVCSR